MQAYGPGFAQVYNARWANFARQVAPLILDFLEKSVSGHEEKPVLDLCCGAGHLARHFLERGYRVTGIDLSEHMLHFARENAGIYLESGQGRFLLADASDFTLDERFGLVVATYDSLNHLDNEQALKSCFRCVHAVSDGYFIFDLNTRRGLNRWNGIHVDDSDDDTVIITRGFFDGAGDKAWMKINGFVNHSNGLYERFDETVFNTVFELERVKELLHEAGWRNVYFAGQRDLSEPLPEPEREGRVFIVAHI